MGLAVPCRMISVRSLVMLSGKLSQGSHRAGAACAPAPTLLSALS